MKKHLKYFTLLMVVCTLGILSGHSQTLGRQVIGSGGGTATSEDSTRSLNFQTGEAVTETVTSGTFVLTQGFEQPDSIKEFITSAEITYKIYPNPSEGPLSIEITGPVNTDITIKLYDINGKELYSRSTILVRGERTILGINFSHLSTAVYSLYFYDSAGNEVQGVKWIKI